jgi:Cof subfamily protein (haloacid dehalogenase superfamily)
MIKLVALDLDGTLLTSRKTITPRTHKAIRAAVAKGVHVVLTTARPPRSVRTYYEQLRLTTPTINYNGALIWDEGKRRVIQHTPLDPKIARSVITYARKLHKEMLVSVEILDKWYTDHYADMPEYATETAKEFTPDFVGPIEAFLTIPITKLMLLGPPEWIAEIELKIPAKFQATVGHTRSDPHLLQVLNPTASKGKALSEVAASFGVAREDVLAMGDAPNDLDMLGWAGTSVTLDNAWDQVKQIAQHMVPGNDDDGVGVAIEKFVLAT